jgi:hypothetical protein
MSRCSVERHRSVARHDDYGAGVGVGVGKTGFTTISMGMTAQSVTTGDVRLNRLNEYV